LDIGYLKVVLDSLEVYTSSFPLEVLMQYNLLRTGICNYYSHINLDKVHIIQLK